MRAFLKISYLFFLKFEAKSIKKILIALDFDQKYF